MRPIYEGDAEFGDMWPGVVLTTEDEQRTLNQAVEALPDTDRKAHVIRSMLTVERFDLEAAGDRSSQAAMDLAWRISGGDTDPSIFPDGRPLSELQTRMALDALKAYVVAGSSTVAHEMAHKIEENLGQSKGL